jgi:DNA-binding MarR family transcriptional regulator
VGRSTVAAIEARIAGSGLAPDEFAVYCLLDIAGPLTPSALGSWMAAPPTTVSAVVKRLERRGHVARRPNPEDGRSHLLALTTEGRRARDAASAAFAPLRDRVQGELGASTGP